MNKLVILPTYNEAKNIVKMIDILFSLDVKFDILVVDDNSPDGTADLVRNSYQDSVTVKVRSKKDGLGSAYVFAFDWALKNGYNFIIQMDADLSHDPQEIPAMFSLLSDNDLVIGSRYYDGLRVINWPLRRLYISYFANLYARFITGVPVRDLTAGFKAWKGDTLRKINFNECSSQGYCFQIETAFRAYQKNCKIIEHPITFTDRTVGESKMDRQVVVEAILKVWLFGFWRLFRLKR
tara:strand:+ start:2981 stop:3691 length:711 start_codon:yes stop_codon:yes gene_type:complete